MIPDSLAETLDRLIEAARAAESAPRPVIGIAGPVASGKTTLAATVADRHGTEVLSTDDYLPNYQGLPRLERDEPHHADLPRLAADIAGLRAGRETNVPVWSFFENRRVDERPMAPGDIIVVEGLFALHPAIADLLDLGVFVNGPAGRRREKFVGRSADGERGFTVKEADAHFDEVAEPTLWKHLDLYRPQVTLYLAHNDAGGFSIRPVESLLGPDL